MSTVELKQKITDLIAKETGIDPIEIGQMFETPKELSHGDLAFPCFRLSKTLRKSPQQIAGDLRAKFSSQSGMSGIARVEQAGGYLNFTFDSAAVTADALKRVLELGSSFGSSKLGANKTIVLEYSSVNIAKPLGIGHLRSTIIGAALNRIYRKLGYKTISINHLGDWGTQFGNLITAYRLWGREYKFDKDPTRDLYSLYVRFHESSKTDPQLIEKGREEFRKLEQGEVENLALWKKFYEYSMVDFNLIYDILDVHFDYMTGESFYREKVGAVVEELRGKNLLQQSEGATIVDLSAFNMPPCLMKKSDESTLYATRDLTALLYRKETFKFDKILYVVGTAQKLHFHQFFKVAELMGNDWIGSAVHVDFGWVKFGDKAMSTREGNLIFFEDVMEEAKSRAREIVTRENPDLDKVEWTSEEVSVAAIVFTQLKVRRTKDVNFIWEDALSFKGETGPYLQYTHARLTSLTQKYGKSLPDLEADLSLLGEEEKQVIKWFEQYPDKIKHAAEIYETSILTDYLLNLASSFNSYWQRIRILTGDAALSRARMQMAYAVRVIIGDGLHLLGIEPLERM